MNGRLRDKVAIVTGAGTGIGEGIAHEGARLTLAGLPGDPVADVAEALRSQGAEVEVYQDDLGEEHHGTACVESTVDRFGRLDVLVNNAGVFPEAAETQDFTLELAHSLDGRTR